MLNPIGRAGSASIAPLLKSGDSSVSGTNWRSLEGALKSAGRFNGTVQLPAGEIYIDSGGKLPALNFDETRAFVTLHSWEETRQF